MALNPLDRMQSSSNLRGAWTRSLARPAAGTLVFSFADSNKFLWEEAALGSGGENICFDPLGSHTRATITDMRPKLFDGAWKENVGGGDFLPLFFGSDGALQYFKELDPQLHANGPCLSNSSYAGVTRDGAVSSRVEISGGRTDDLVRVFFHVQLRVLTDTDFTRLALFTLGSETYNYHSEFTEFVVGGAGVPDAHTPRTCTGGTSKESSKLYDSPGPKRTAMAGVAPWWFALGPNEDATAFNATSHMVVGDRGLVVRSFSGQLGGVAQSAPTFSVLCDKIELGTPAGLRSLVAGDFVDMMLEVLVLPRAGQEYEAARANSGSNTLTNTLAGLATWERVKLQAEHGHLAVTPENNHSRVESHYPVRVCAASPEASTTSVMFDIEGAALGFTPITICGLATHAVPTGGTHGLWLKPEGAADFTLLTQGSSGLNDFWQTNYDRAAGTYEVVYNAELLGAPRTTVAFGSHPDLWVTPSPTPAPTTSSPTPAPTPSPTPAPSPGPTPAPTPSPSPPTTVQTPSPTTVQTPPPTAVVTAGQATAPAAGPRLRMQFDNADYDGLTAAGLAHIESTAIAHVLAQSVDSQSVDSITSADIKEVVISKGSIIVTVIFWDNITDATVSDLAGLISAAPVSLVLNSTHTTGAASTLLMSTVSAQGAPVASAQDQDEGLGGGAIAGIVVGVLLAIALVVAVSYVLLYRRARISSRGPSADAKASLASLWGSSIGRRISSNTVELSVISIIKEAGIVDSIRRDSIQAEELVQRRGSSATVSETMPAPGDEPDADTHNEAPDDEPDADTHKAAPDYKTAPDYEHAMNPVLEAEVAGVAAIAE